jgi:hypothetical protein
MRLLRSYRSIVTVHNGRGTSATRRPVARRHLVRRGALAAACATWAYLRLVRPWHQRWGATDNEVERPLPGDEEIPTPTVQSTRALTIAAPPQEVWPWIAQIGYVGYGRAGWYAFDFWDANAGGGRSSRSQHRDGRRGAISAPRRLVPAATGFLCSRATHSSRMDPPRLDTTPATADTVDPPVPPADDNRSGLGCARCAAPMIRPAVVPPRGPR